MTELSQEIQARYLHLRRQGFGHAHALDILLREYGLLHLRAQVESLLKRNVRELDLC
jgi:hypothetical protein